jgi:hypothetical protein
MTTFTNTSHPAERLKLKHADMSIGATVGRQLKPEIHHSKVLVGGRILFFHGDGYATPRALLLAINL